MQKKVVATHELPLLFASLSSYLLHLSLLTFSSMPLQHWGVHPLMALWHGWSLPRTPLTFLWVDHDGTWNPLLHKRFFNLVTSRLQFFTSVHGNSGMDGRYQEHIWTVTVICILVIIPASSVLVNFFIDANAPLMRASAHGTLAWMVFTKNAHELSLFIISLSSYQFHLS